MHKDSHLKCPLNLLGFNQNGNRSTVPVGRGVTRVEARGLSEERESYFFWAICTVSKANKDRHRAMMMMTMMMMIIIIIIIIIILKTYIYAKRTEVRIASQDFSRRTKW